MKEKALLGLESTRRRLVELLSSSSSSSGWWRSMKELKQIHALMIRTHHLLYTCHGHDDDDDDEYPRLRTRPCALHWNMLIRSYTNLHSPSKALLLFSLMLSHHVPPDSYSLPISFKASSLLLSVPFGRQLHSLSFRLGLLHSNPHCQTSLITLYSKCGEFSDAYKVFDHISLPKLESFNALIAGLSQGGRAMEALRMFIHMRTSGLQPDDFTMTTVLSACGSTGDLDLAFQLHKHVFHATPPAVDYSRPHILMLNSLVDMYAKCGRMDLASLVFHRMQEKNVSSWTSMITGYAMHGHANRALDLFRCMREAGVTPNHVTFVGVLSACVHGGKVEEGRYYFAMMKDVYGIMPQLQHYGCMVDMLGRVGLLREARQMVEEMPMEANVVIWGCLMGACDKYGDVEMGEWVATHLRELEPWNDGVYVVLSNIYATRGLWQKVEKLRLVMKHQNLSKIPAYSLATDSS